MKQTLTITTTILALCATSLYAAPRGNGHNHKGKHARKANAGDVAERAATREEEMLHRKDAHVWKKDPEAKDHRHENLREYTSHTYKRIVRLLILGAIEEADGTKFKTRHAAIGARAKAANAANANGLDDSEKKAIRTSLNTLNDNINAAITEAEKGNDRTPLVNRAQHRFEERIASGIKSGRLSTLEASSLRRKTAKLEGLEKRLKSGKKLSTNERERLMKEVIELHRDLAKALRN